MATLDAYSKKSASLRLLSPLHNLLVGYVQNLFFFVSMLLQDIRQFPQLLQVVTRRCVSVVLHCERELFQILIIF